MKGPTKATCRIVDARAGECCELCGVHAEGGSRHHRRMKGMGGDQRPDTHLPSNLLLLCGSGTTGCHNKVHANPAWSMDHGLLVRQSASPAAVPVQLLIGRVLLDDQGNYNHMEEA